MKHTHISHLRATVYASEVINRSLAGIACDAEAELEELRLADMDAAARAVLLSPEEGLEDLSAGQIFRFIRAAKRHGKWEAANRLWHVLARRALRGEEDLGFVAFNDTPDSGGYYAVLSVGDRENLAGIPCPLLSEGLLRAVVNHGYVWGYSGESYDE